MTLTEKQIQELDKPLDPKNVEKLDHGSKAEYVTGWHVINEANRIFGFAGWSDETIYCKEVSRVDVKIGQQKMPGFKIGYEAKVRVYVGDIFREGTGFGSGIAKDLADCIEGAAKEAETDALKRALRKFGNVFGLALYDKQKKQVKDVEVYEMDTRKMDVLKSETIKKLRLSANIPALSKNWAALVKDMNEVKRHKKEWYAEIVDVYTQLKKELPNENV